MGLCGNHDSLYFDTLNRTKKSETVLSLIYSTYYASGETKDERKANIALRLVDAYKTLKGGAGTYSGDLGQFSSQYTIGHEMGIWKNSSLELTEFAISVAENRITIRDYFDRAFLNYIQPVNNTIVHLLFHLLKYMQEHGLTEVTKDEMSQVYMGVSGATEPGHINGAFNMLLGSNYFVARSSNILEYVGAIPINSLIEKCNTKYVIEGYGQALVDLDSQEKYAEYLLSLPSNTRPSSVSHNNLPPLDEPLQKIVYGAPGTGKSHGTDGKIKEVYPDKDVEKKYVFRTTFHPDSDYSTFVGCYKPTKIPTPRVSGYIDDSATSEEKNQLTYEFVPQSFTKAYVAAWKTKLEGENKPVFLVIEEINRGNCAQIFGDLFQLLDRKGGFSEYPIKPDTDLGNYLKEEFQKAGLTSDEYKAVVDGEELILPNNLYIWATMNTSDQSLFPIDSAFKRRWDWEYMPIDKGTDENGKELEWKIEVGGAEYDWWSFLTIINDLIASDPSLGEDKQLGYFFCKAKEGIIDEKMFVNKVCFYLWNDVFKDFLPTHKALQTTDESSKSRNIRFTDFFKEGHTALINNFLKELGVKEYTSPASAETESAEDEDDDEEGLNDTQRQYRKLWGEFLSYAGSKSDFKSRFNLERKPSKENWMNFRFGATDCYLAVTQLLRDKEVSVALYFNEETPTYHDLHAQSEQIHADLGFELDWINKSENKCSMAILRKKNADFDNESKKQEQFEFIVDKLLKMREVFSKYLNLSTEA